MALGSVLDVFGDLRGMAVRPRAFDDSLEDSANLPDPHLLAQEIADDLRSALAQIEDVPGDLEQRATAGGFRRPVMAERPIASQ